MMTATIIITCTFISLLVLQYDIIWIYLVYREPLELWFQVVRGRSMLDMGQRGTAVCKYVETILSELPHVIPKKIRKWSDLIR